jgi:hypothetical protein
MTAPRRLAAILAADVVGYSRLMGEDQAVRDLREAAAPIVTGHGKRVFKTMGEVMLIEFPSVIVTVDCAIAIQKLMTDRMRANARSSAAQIFAACADYQTDPSSSLARNSDAVRKLDRVNVQECSASDRSSGGKRVAGSLVGGDLVGGYLVGGYFVGGNFIAGDFCLSGEGSRRHR